MQAFHFLIQTARALAIQPVGDEQNDRPLPQHAARPLVVELVQRLADARAARPVLDLRRGFLQGDVDVAIAQGPRHVRQARAEGEAVDPVAVVGDRVHEMQEHPRVAGHRAGDVAQDDQRRRPAARFAPCAAPSALPAASRGAARRGSRCAGPGGPTGNGACGAPAPAGAGGRWRAGRRRSRPATSARSRASAGPRGPTR